MMMMMESTSQREQVVANHCVPHVSLTTTTMRLERFEHYSEVVVLVRQNVRQRWRMVVRTDPTETPKRTATAGYVTLQCSRIATPFGSVLLDHVDLCPGSHPLVFASSDIG